MATPVFKGQRDGISARAASIIKRFKLTGPPLILEELCAAVGVDLFCRPFDYVAGVLIADDVFPAIIVNARDTRVRQRFTVAHELGHYFLRHPGTTFAEPSGPSRQEREAERFAACLLMPEQWVREAWRAYAANAENRVDILTELFEVSKAAMAVRLKELKLRAAAPRGR